jgi:NAD(P)-dependent dehydrogenase (short-subunit alcohol dehydrogenase family)
MSEDPLNDRQVLDRGGEAFMGKVLPRVSMRRWRVGDDFGGVAVYLASDASKYRTGDTFAIDGGYGIL